MNPAQPVCGTVLCRLDEIERAKGFQFREGDDVFLGFVIRHGGGVKGYVDSCPHTGQPLSTYGDRYMTKDGRWLFCSGHGALFRPHDGEAISGPCTEGLRAWPVEVRDGMVVVA